MEKKLLTAFPGLVLVLSLSYVITKQRHIHYPKPYPDSVAIPFLPGVVSVDGLDFNSAFSPDGKSFYFSRSSKGQWDIFVSKFEKGAWSRPVRVSFSDDTYSEADPAFSPDGKLFFISNRPRSNELIKNDFDIWYVEPTESATWSTPINLSRVNSDSSEYYISFSDNGNLYFGSSRTGGYGSDDIYVSRVQNGVYMSPENLGANVNSPHSEHDPYVFDAERLIIFKSENRKDGFGQADLYFSTSDETGEWSEARNLGARINTEGYEYCPYISPDGKYFFFSSISDIMWINMHAVRKIIMTEQKK